MSLSPQQQQVAVEIEQRAISHGIPPNRARELALAAFHESGLRPDAKGPAVGSYGGQRAGGLFQLLSSGYVSRANQHGGVFDPAANQGAIEGDYAAFWKSHPNAPVGAAAAAVERSGEGAGWYGAGLDQIPVAGGGRQAGSRPPFAPGHVQSLPQPQVQGDPGAGRKAFATGILGSLQEGHGRLDPNSILGAISARDAAAAPTRTVQAAPQPAQPKDVPAGAGILPVDTGGLVHLAAGADRKGVSTNPAVIEFAAQIAKLYGHPLTIGTGTNHNQFVVNSHRQSDHWTGNAADIPSSGAALTRLGQDALISAGMDPAEARKQTGGVYNIGRYQILFNTNTGGNHFNHLHVGVR